MGNARNYTPVIRFLDPHTFTCVFADLRGYGRSKHIKGAYIVDAAARDVFVLADSLGWGSFHVVGHSMSRMLAQRMAIDNWMSETHCLKSVIAIRPMTAPGDMLDHGFGKFVWEMIHDRSLFEWRLALLSSNRLLPTGREENHSSCWALGCECVKGLLIGCDSIPLLSGGSRKRRWRFR